MCFIYLHLHNTWMGQILLLGFSNQTQGCTDHRLISYLSYVFKPQQKALLLLLHCLKNNLHIIYVDDCAPEWVIVHHMHTGACLCQNRVSDSWNQSERELLSYPVDARIWTWFSWKVKSALNQKHFSSPCIFKHWIDFCIV